MFNAFQMPQGWGGIGQVGMGANPALQYSQGSSQGPQDTESRVPVINLKDGTRLAGDDAPRRKDLEQWLNEHPGFVADTGAFIPVGLSSSFCNCITDILFSSNTFARCQCKALCSDGWLMSKFTHVAHLDHAVGETNSPMCSLSNISVL